jgi:hypothetical protein
MADPVRGRYVPETTAFLESLVSSRAPRGLKPTAPAASADYDLGFDVKLRYLCNDAQCPRARRASPELRAVCWTQWTYIGFPVWLGRRALPAGTSDPGTGRRAHHCCW